MSKFTDKPVDLEAAQAYLVDQGMILALPRNMPIIQIEGELGSLQKRLALNEDKEVKVSLVKRD